MSLIHTAGTGDGLLNARSKIWMCSAVIGSNQSRLLSSVPCKWIRPFTITEQKSPEGEVGPLGSLLYLLWASPAGNVVAVGASPGCKAGRAIGSPAGAATAAQCPHCCAEKLSISSSRCLCGSCVCVVALLGCRGSILWFFLLYFCRGVDITDCEAQIAVEFVTTSGGEL